MDSKFCKDNECREEVKCRLKYLILSSSNAEGVNGVSYSDSESVVKSGVREERVLFTYLS